MWPRCCFPGEQDSEVESSNFSALNGKEGNNIGQYDDAETDDEVVVVEDLKRA